MPFTENQLHQLPTILTTAADLVYNPLNFFIDKLKIETESKEYVACTFQLNGLRVIHRQSKITPSKTGQFVTIWKRNETGITSPFEEKDDFDLLVISARMDNRIGQFIFPKAILAKNKIISQNDLEGKRGFRIYPPWDTVGNKQAEKTQEWQRPYFLEIDLNGNTDLAPAKKLITI